MNTQKGILFEKTSSYCIFLTPDGLFQKGLPLPASVQVGEEALYRPFSDTRKRTRRANNALTAPIIAMAAIIVLFFSVLLPSQSSVSAFVQIDINPSIELGIDDEGTVQVFRGINEDGKTIKHDIPFWKGQSLSWVLQQIVDRTESIIKGTESIEITTIYQEEINHKTLEKVIATAVTTTTSQIVQKNHEVKVIEASLAERDAANIEGISVQKYKAEIEVENKKENQHKEQEEDKDQIEQEQQVPSTKQQNTKLKNPKPADQSKDFKREKEAIKHKETPKQEITKKDKKQPEKKDSHNESKKNKQEKQKNEKVNGKTSDHNKNNGNNKYKNNGNDNKTNSNINNKNNDNKKIEKTNKGNTNQDNGNNKSDNSKNND